MFELYSESKCPSWNSRKILDPNFNNNESFSVWFIKVIVTVWLSYSDQSWKYSLDRISLCSIESWNETIDFTIYYDEEFRQWTILE